MLTILTPTFNRARTLPRLYESLRRQRASAFEWLVVDDGSTDDTRALLARFAANAPFPVRVIHQPNGGKHVAVNTGVAQARGTWLFIVDSDDWLPGNALKVVLEALRDLAAHPEVQGVCFRRTDAVGQLLGRDCTDWPVPWETTPTRAGRAAGGDLAYVFRRRAMAAEPFPVIAGERFVPDQYAWNRIADRGAIRFFLDRAVYCCEYQDDGYTRNFSRCLRRNPRGFLLFYADQIRREPYGSGKLKALLRCLQCMVWRVVRVLWPTRKHG